MQRFRIHQIRSSHTSAFSSVFPPALKAGHCRFLCRPQRKAPHSTHNRFHAHSVEEILNAPFYLTERNANYRQALEQELALHKQTLSPVLECSDTAFIKKMLKTGKGLSYLPLFVVEKDIEEGKIAKLDVKDIDITMYRQVFYHANKYMTKEMEKFIEYCQM